MTAIKHLTCEYQINPIGIGMTTPRLSWQMVSEQRGARQTAYQIRAAADPDMQTILWDTGKVISDQSAHIPYAGPALSSAQRVYWQARLWDESDNDSGWSEPAFFEMGLLHESDWQAVWITPDWDEDTTQSQPQPVLRRVFQINGAVASARVYATALGLYELRVNGQRAGDDVLTPGWTAYDKRLQVQTCDVTGLLREGENVIGALLGDGWYRGWLGFEGNRNTYGDRLALLCQLVVTYADGRTEVVTTDAHWRATTGPIRMSDIYMGETYNAQMELPGWDAPGYNASAWKGVRQLDHGKGMLVAQAGPPVKRHEELKPAQIILTPAGETVLDFGQNMVGRVRITAQGPAGATLTLRHAEVLDQQGNLYVANLRSAKQTVQYTFKGEGVETYEPRFTFMGFRYVAVDGWPGDMTLEAARDAFTGVVVHSDIPRTGTFECSNPLINQLQHNIVWGQKGNFVDVPTDCPQRDERLGWTGDAQVFIRTACFNHDVASFFTRWLADLAAEQDSDGGVPMVIPNGLKRSTVGQMGGGSAAWADAATICPWTIYWHYGDQRILEQQYASMKAWVEYMRRQAGERYLWTSGFHFGDWLDYRGQNAFDATPITDKELIATAFFAYSTSLTQQAAQVLGRTDEAGEYADLLSRIKAAFNAEFVSANGRVGSNSQSSYVLALHFDLLPEKLRQKAADRLAEEVRKFDYHLTTGFVGTPYLCHVLSRFGHTDLAYELLNQESFPSWLYPVKMGATTIWERWDGIKPDGTFQDAGMNSFNHYAYGAIGDWMYRVVAGIDAGEAGYRHVVIAPRPGGGLTYARATLRTIYGEVVSAWQLSEAGLRLQVSVPPNTRATVRLPAGKLARITEGGQPLKKAPDIRASHIKGGVAEIEIGAGQYDFASAGLTLAQTMASVRHVAGRLDMGSKLRDLLADERAKAILVKHAGEQVLQANIPAWVGDQSLDSLARTMPHLLTPETLKAIQADLTAL